MKEPFTVPRGASVYDLANRIQELQSHPDLRCQIAETAQTEVLSQCNETVMTDRIESYLEASLQMWQMT